MLQVIFQPTPSFHRLQVYSIAGKSCEFHSAKPKNLQFTFLVVGITNHAPGSQNKKGPKVPNSKKKHNSTELKLTEPSSRIIPIFVVQPFLFNQRFPRQWLVSESSCLVPLDPTLFLLERRFFGLGKEKQTTKNTAKKQKRLQPI